MDSVAFVAAEACSVPFEAECLPEVVGREVVGAPKADTLESVGGRVVVEAVYELGCVAESPGVVVRAELVDA